MPVCDNVVANRLLQASICSFSPGSSCTDRACGEAAKTEVLVAYEPCLINAHILRASEHGLLLSNPSIFLPSCLKMSLPTRCPICYLRFVKLSHLDDDLAFGVSFFDVGQSVFGRCKGKDTIHNRADDSGIDERGDLAQLVPARPHEQK